MATSLGLVGIVNKGNYSASATYVKGNFVYHDHSTWLLIVPSATGITPSLQASTTWQPLALGVNLEVFTEAIADTESSPATQAHAVDEQFFYNDTLYTVIASIAVGDTLTVGTNIQESESIVDQLGSHKGHVIKNSSGTSLTDRTALQFENGYVEDDSVNDKTVIRSTNFVGTLAQWNALTAAEKVKYKTADITDDFNGSPVDDALSDTSSNPVQNRVVKAAIDNLQVFKQSSIMSKSVTVEGGSNVGISGDDLGYSIPTGYRAIGYNIMNMDSSGLYLYSLNLGATETSTVLRVANRTSSNITANISLHVIFARDNLFS